MKKFKSKKWGFDLDGVCFDVVGTILAQYNKRTGSVFAASEVTDWDFETALKLKGEDAETLKDCIKNVLINCPKPKEHFGAYDFISGYFKRTGNIPIFITSRPQYSVSATYDLVSSFMRGIPYKLYFTKDKVGIIKIEGVELFVEDRARNLFSIKEAEVTTMAMIRPWNVAFVKKFEEKGIIPVYSWYDLVAYFYDNVTEEEKE